MKHWLFLMLFCCAVCASAQDVIVKKDGSTVVCRVLEVKNSEVVYKLWTERNGSSYIMDISLVSSINYESGKKESFSEIMENKYSPYNQSNGERQINDKALMVMDYKANGGIWKGIGLLTGGIIIGGGMIVAGGVLIESGIPINNDECRTRLALGSCLLPIGTACFIAGLWKGSKMIHEYKKVQSYALFQQDFNFKNGSSITPSIDMLKYTDKGFNTQTIGLGLSYNF